MPRLFVPPVPVTREAKQIVLHHLRKRCLADLNQMMNVIAHEHIGVQSVAKSPLALFEKIQITLTISIVFEDRLPLITPTHDVIERADEMYPPLSGHSYGTIVGNLQNSKKVCLTPFLMTAPSVFAGI